MTYHCRFAPSALIGGFILTAILAGSSPARAEVIDNGKFFSPDAIARANATMAQMKRDTGKEMLVETFPSIPADRAADYTPQNKAAFFQKWAADQFRTNHVNGVYVLINRDPSHLFVTAGDTTRKAFTTTDDDRLRDSMLGPMREKRYDDALTAGVQYADQRLRAAAPAAAAGTRAPENDATPAAHRQGPTQGSPSNFPAAPGANGQRSFGFGSLIILGIVAFIVIMILRRLFGGARGAAAGGYSGQPGTSYGPNYGPGAGAGSGGFGRGLLGGLLGGVAGGYLQDRLAHRNDPTSGSDPGSSTHGAGGSLFNEPGADSHSDAGSFGDFGGGGDSGGGGGGDSGSSGGSGGDF